MAVVVLASGELDALSTDRLAEHLEAAAGPTTSPSAVLLGVTGFTYLSSAGVATLVLHTLRRAEQGRRLCLVADPPAVLRTPSPSPARTTPSTSSLPSKPPTRRVTRWATSIGA